MPRNQRAVARAAPDAVGGRFRRLLSRFFTTRVLMEYPSFFTTCHVAARVPDLDSVAASILTAHLHDEVVLKFLLDQPSSQCLGKTVRSEG